VTLFHSQDPSNPQGRLIAWHIFAAPQVRRLKPAMRYNTQCYEE
jgi:hypothetical protein